MPVFSDYKLLFLVLIGVSLVSIKSWAGDVAQPLPIRSFVADRTARSSGDTLTVLITELASISTTATTRLAKDDNLYAGISSPELGSRQWGAGLGGDFSGGGKIERGGRFVAKLAVTVDEVDVQGNLHVKGEQEIAVNRERQHIRLTGIVRQEDLSAENTIESWRIRDAHIEFVGTGDLAKRQTPTFMSRVLSWFGIL